MNLAALEAALPIPALASRGFYFAGDDRLRLSSWNSLASVTVVLTGRFLHVDGRVEAFSEVHTPNTNRTAATSSYNRAEGWLMDLSVVVTGATPQRGQTFVRVDVVRGLGSVDVVLSTLLQGYVTATKRLGYPGSPIEDSLAGQGCLRSITGTDPAAGVEISETVPTGARWRLIAFEMTLVTSGVAGNRRPTLIADDGAAAFFRAHAGTNLAASGTGNYTGSAAPQPIANLGSDIPLGLPPNALLLAAARIRTSTTAIDPGDNYGAPQYEVEEWLEAI